MNRELIVLKEDLQDKESYGFMAMPTPKGYMKKAQKVMQVTDNEITILDKEENVIEVIAYDNIQKANISLCSRVASSAGFGGGLTTVVHVDLDLVMKDESVICFEVVRPDTFEIVFACLHHHHIEVNDPIKVEDIYTQMTGAGTRSKYLSGNFGKMARKHKLDHPRR